MSNLVFLPIVIPLLTATLLLWEPQRLRFQKGLCLLGTGLTLATTYWLAWRVHAAGIQVAAAGNWQPPFGIALVADHFSALMLAAAMTMAMAVLLYALRTVDPARQKHRFYALYQFLLFGVNGSFLTGDLFNLFVFFEVMLIASFVMVALGGEAYQLREGFKYMVLNLVSSAFFLVGIGLVYGMAGTLNMAHLTERLADAPLGLLTAVALVFLVTFGLKAAVFPLYVWMPSAYFGPPMAVTALFGGLLTKVGVYALIRVYALLFAATIPSTQTLLLVVAGVTMVVGVLGAVAQVDIKMLLSYHIISQIGYMVMGLAIFTELAIAGAILHIAHNIVVKSSLFVAAGITEEVTGTTNLKKIGGLFKGYPVLAGLFFIAGVSLAGGPPLSGFVSKFVLVAAGLAAEEYAIAGVALGVGLLTLYSMMKILRLGFWGSEEGERRMDGAAVLRLTPALAILVSVSLGMGAGAEFFVEYARLAAAGLLEPAVYVETVLSLAPR